MKPSLDHKVSLADQVACIRREVQIRDSVYARWVEAGKMTETRASAELSTMRAVLETLTQIAKEKSA